MELLLKALPVEGAESKSRSQVKELIHQELEVQARTGVVSEDLNSRAGRLAAHLMVDLLEELGQKNWAEEVLEWEVLKSLEKVGYLSLGVMEETEH